MNAVKTTVFLPTKTSSEVSLTTIYTGSSYIYIYIFFCLIVKVQDDTCMRRLSW